MTATRWWDCPPESVRGTRRGTARSLAVNSTTSLCVRGVVVVVLVVVVVMVVVLTVGEIE